MSDELASKYKLVSFRELVPEIPSTTFATFGLYPYPAKFIPQVVAYALKTYVKSRSKVFDPFAGYGTAGVVARVYGHDYELWDLNPLLEVLHSVAIQPPKCVDVDGLLRQMRGFEGEFVPRWSNIDYWYPQEFLPLLYKAWGFYHSLEDDVKLVLAVPLMKVTKHFSYDDLQCHKFCRSPRSLKRVESLLARDWRAEFFRLLRAEVEKVLRGVREYWRLSPKEVRCVVKGGVDSLSMDLEEDKDVLITSPPYLQSHEYIRKTKMDLFWLGFSEYEVKRLSGLEIPYRDARPQPIYSETYSELEGQIKEPRLLRTFRNYFWSVIGALTRFQAKITSYMFLFAGRPSLRGRPIPIDQILAEHFSSLGWTHVETLVDKIVARRLPSLKANPATGIIDSRTQTENLVVLKRKR